MKYREKIVEPQQMREIRAQLREQGRQVVQCHGCFDIVHPGHLRYLSFASSQGDILVVSVSADSVVGKGVDRPYINQDLRLENLAALEFVDYVVLDDHDWAGPILETIEPDIYVKGKEYETKGDPRFLREKELVESYGGSVVYSSGDVVFSSTSIIDQFSERFRLDSESLAFYCRHHQIDLAGVEELLRRCSGLRVLVVGDAILDRYVDCDTAAVAAESPMLSVTVLGEERFVGGAGLIAGQLAALGAKASFLSPTSASDPKREVLANQLAEAGVEFLEVQVENRAIYEKKRYIVDGKKLFKVNVGHPSPLPSLATEEVLATFRRRLDGLDAVILTDFGYGLFGETLVEKITAACREAGVPYFADVSETGRANILKFREPALVTPNEHELRFAFGDSISGLSSLANRYYRETGARSLVLTLGKRGAIHFAAPDEVDGGERLVATYLRALNNSPVDTVGAGDVFLATLGLLQVAGAEVPAALFVASGVAALHVGRLGNAPVDIEQLHRYLAEMLSAHG
jgi:rfaE bifunctional protein kinase chain/domain/rfaE bifunctional protein nucleotidyltransferase chain/domain